MSLVLMVLKRVARGYKKCSNDARNQVVEVWKVGSNEKQLTPCD